jgi:hypothetical protein
MVTREAIVAAARSFIGTPYHHQASCKKAGCDCLGLIRGVWRDVYRPEPEAPGQYHRSLSAKETMHEYPHLAHHRRLRQGRRTQVLGVTTALSAIALWGVGDMSLADLLGKLPIALGGLGLSALGAKVDDATETKTQGSKSAKAK